MPTFNDILGEQGKPFSITAGEKTYTFSPLTLKRKAAFERWMEGRAVQAAQKMREHLPPEEYTMLLAKVSRDIADGHYGFGGPAFLKLMGTLDGQAQLLFVLAADNDADLKAEDLKAAMIAHQADFAAAFTVLFPQGEEAPDPPKPATTPTTSAS